MGVSAALQHFPVARGCYVPPPCDTELDDPLTGEFSEVGRCPVSWWTVWLIVVTLVGMAAIAWHFKP